MKTSLHHFSTRRVAGWQGEREFLQHSLAHEPDAVQAWWWKLRLRVLAFVIARYGAAPAVRARGHAPEPRDTGGDFTFGERCTVEPRPRSALGPHLQSIASANDFPRPPASPENDDQLQTRRTGVRFVCGAILGAIFGGGYAMAAGIADRAEIIAVATVFWVGCGALAVILGGPLSSLVARLLTRK